MKNVLDEDDEEFYIENEKEVDINDLAHN